jgi:hypothetical protein
MHGSAELGMWVGKDDRGADRLGTRHAVGRRRRQIEDRFEKARRTVEISDSWHGRNR